MKKNNLLRKLSIFVPVIFLLLITSTISQNTTETPQILNSSAENLTLTNSLNKTQNSSLENISLDQNLTESSIQILNESIEPVITNISIDNNEFVYETENSYQTQSTPGDISTCQTLNVAGVYNLIASPASTSGNCFLVTVDNISIEGNGFTIDGTDSAGSSGVYAFGRKNITVNNLRITDFYYGIYFTNTVNSTVDNSIISSCYNGIQSSISGAALNYGNNFTNNTVNYNRNIGMYLYRADNSLLLENKVNYNTNKNINLEYGKNNTLQNNTARYSSSTSTGSGVYLYYSNYTTLLNNDLSYNKRYGLYGQYTYFTIINGGNFTNQTQPTDYGIYFTGLCPGGSITNTNVNGNTYGIYISMGGNFTVSNNYLDQNAYGIYFSNSNENNTIYNNSVFNSNYYGIYANSIGNSTVDNNKINQINYSGYGSSLFGIYASANNRMGNKITNNVITNISNTGTSYGSTYGLYSNGILSEIENNTIINVSSTITNSAGPGMYDGFGIYLSNERNSTIYNNFVDNANAGLLMAGSQGNIIDSLSIYNSNKDAILLQTAYSNNNTFSNLSIQNTNPKYYDFKLYYFFMTDSYINETIFSYPYIIGNYSFTYPAGGKFTFESSYGEIKFTSPLVGNGNNLTYDVQIKNNSAFINPLVPTLNSPANITFYSMPTTFVNPQMLKNDQICTDCVNFTSLNSGTVKFYVSGNGNYTIEEYDTVPPSITLNRPIESFNTSSRNLIFNFTAIDDQPINLNCSLYIDSIFITSNTSTLNNTLTNLNASNISGGLHYWNISCRDKRNINYSETRSFYVDIFAPTVSNIVYSPNSSDDLDPGRNVTFNATVIDDRVNVSSVILQYHNGTAWANRTLFYLGNNIYQANITLALIQANYTFNIWSNDTFNNANNTVNQTFSSVWDCSWTVSPQDAGAYPGWTENKEIFNLTINNTGDPQYANNNCTLAFHIVHNLDAGRIYFNNSFTNQWANYYDIPALSAKAYQNIKVNASFLTSVLEESLRITSSEVSARSSTSSRNTTANLISTTGGPYLFQKLDANSMTLDLTLQNISLSSYLRDITANGSDNFAYNVSFNWSLPGNFLTDQNYTFFLDNLTDNSLSYNNINLTFNATNLPELSPKTYTLTLYSSGFNSSGDLIQHAGNKTLLSESINITFLCYAVSDGVCVTSCGYLLDPDCSPPVEPVLSGGGGGGGSSGTSQFFSKFIKAQSFELVRGKNQSFIIEFENPYKDGQLTDLKINLTGFLAQYISISPSFVSLLKESEKVNLTAKITAPAYFTEGSYDLKLVIGGKYKLNESSSQFTAEKIITLKIFEVGRTDSESYLNLTLGYIKEMNSSKFNILKISNLYSEMLGYYEKDDFTNLKKTYDSAKIIYNNAIDADKQIKEIKDLIAKAESDGLKTPETGKLLALAESAFLRGSYDTAISRLKEAKLSYALEVKGEFNVLRFVKNNPLQVSGGVIALACLVTVSSIFLRYRSLKRKLRLLGEEEDLLIGLMRVVQRECFELKKLSMEEYQNTILQYEARLSKVIQEKIESETKLSNVIRLKGGRKKSMEKEADRLKEMIKETQKKYFEFGKLETRIYENMIKSYISKLSDVEEKLATIEAHEQMKKFGFNVKK